MSDASPEPATPPATPPPRAFTQGVGTVFQVAGATMFLVLATICCGSSLLSKTTAERHDLTRIGWGHRDGQVLYSAQRAISVSMFVGVGLGVAVASVGLGLQATHRSAAVGGVAVTAFGLMFWVVHMLFAARVIDSIILSVIAGAILVVFAVLFALALAAWREMRRDPPPAGHEVLPEGYKVPYSWYHDDPPELRLAKELEQRRERLAVQQKELEMLEERLKKKQARQE